MKQIEITECGVEEALSQIDALEALSPKNKNILRLLAEEMFSMVRELLHAEALDFTIRHDGEAHALRAAVKTRVDTEAREQFLSMSTSGENAANKGVKGVLGAILESLSFEGDPLVFGPAWGYGMDMTGGEYTCLWTLSRYMDAVPQEKAESSWDGMEKSIIANFADDVAIGVRSGRLEMTVTKTF